MRSCLFRLWGFWAQGLTSPLSCCSFGSAANHAIFKALSAGFPRLLHEGLSHWSCLWIPGSGVLGLPRVISS